MEHLWNDRKYHPNPHENGHKLCDETGNPVLSLLESQWKLRQQHDQSFPIKRKPSQNKYILVSEERAGNKYINAKEQDCESHRPGSE